VVCRRQVVEDVGVDENRGQGFEGVGVGGVGDAEQLSTVMNRTAEAANSSGSLLAFWLDVTRVSQLSTTSADVCGLTWM
jgi:hypothetical protein